MELTPEDFVEPTAGPVDIAPPPSTAHNVFFGRFGFRAGWGIAIFLVCFMVLAVLGGLFSVASTGKLHEISAARAHNSAHPNEPKIHIAAPFIPKLVLISDGIQFLGMLGVCWFFARAERRRLGVYGIGRTRLLDILPGALWGLIALSLLVFILQRLHLLVFDARPLHGLSILLYGLKWLLAFLAVGFAEEYLFRGYLFFTTERGIFGLAEKLSPTRSRFLAFWIAATLMSLVFGALHLGNGGENTLGILQVVLVGFVFSYTLWRTGSLWWAIGFHTTWDWAQSFLYGVADSGNISVGRLFVTHPTGKPLLSGGIDGPEGSILCIPIMLLVLLIVRFTTKPGTQPPLEQQPLPQPETLSIA